MGLRKLVDQLAPSQRIVIDLMYFEGYTQSEIAQELAIPLGTVKTRARSALQLLRKLM
ncbi:sigma-70 family RNA polymerase sigma factor [Adhaeribacter pallidiroseus]|nr:sigma-70 family RNA polymerase sigma factor [Adhaeribacter pallidiroseus]